VIRAMVFLILAESAAAVGFCVQAVRRGFMEGRVRASQVEMACKAERRREE